MKLLLVPALILALAVPANADHCTTWWTESPEADLDLGVGRYYWDNDPCQPCDGTVAAYEGSTRIGRTMYVYEESNGIDGLQRNDATFDSTCHGMISSDTIVF